MNTLEKELEHITNQLCECVDNEFTSRIETEHDSIALQKLVMLINFTIDSTQRALNELMYNNRHLEQIVQNRTFELRLAKDKAEKANLAKDQFIANISHELRTPLNGIMGVTQILETSNYDSRTEQLINIIKNSSDHLLHLLNDILDLSKIDSGNMSLEHIAFNLDTEAKHALNWFKDKAEQKHLNIKFQNNIDAKRYFKGDPTRLKQILANLLGNAIKFTPNHGDIEILIHEDASTSPASIHFEIKDTGIGIDKELHESIFAAFCQADNTTTRKFGGTGLGLTISKKLVTQMGGSIEVTSVIDQGSNFHFNLPLEATDAPKDIAAPSHEGSPVIPAGTGKKQTGYILLAEDNPTNQIVAKELLESLGYVIDIAEDGNRAIEQTKQHDYDLILMDCHMPNLNGFDATIALRKDIQFKKPIIALTADLNSDTKKEVFQAGMNDFVSKPFDKDKLNAVIQDHLNAHQCNEALEKRKAQMLDEKIVDKLKSTVFGNNENLFTKIAKTFIEHSGKLVTDIQEGSEQNDKDKVFHASHSLKSSSATIGALNLSDISEHIEALSHADSVDWKTISELSTQLSEEFETVVVLLNKELEQE